jgi:APA family basic amino acid/polyamine antiporter
MTGLPAITWIRFVAWLFIGLIIYFTYGYTHSLLHPKNLRRGKGG